MPLRAAWPECRGFVIVPKFSVTPLANDAAMPMTSGITVFGVLSSRAQAAATANVPTVLVACQPPSREIVGAARDIRPQISAPMMKAARISDGEPDVIRQIVIHGVGGDAVGKGAPAASRHRGDDLNHATGRYGELTLLNREHQQCDGSRVTSGLIHLYPVLSPAS